MDHYDEKIDVKNSRDIESPIDFDVSNAISFVKQDDLERLSDGEFDRSVDMPPKLSKMEERRPKSGVPGKSELMYLLHYLD